MSRLLVLPVGMSGASSRDFDGIDDWIQAGTSDDLNLSGLWTLETWILLKSLPPLVYFIFGRDAVGARSYCFGFDAVGAMYYENNNGFAGRIGGIAAVGTRPPIGTWTYISFGYDGTQIRSRCTSAPSANSICAAASSVVSNTNIGRRAYVGNERYIPAYLWCMRVWKGRYTSDAEFAKHARGEHPDTANMVRWWPLEDTDAAWARELVTGVPCAVTGASIDPNVPFRPRLAAPARVAVP